MFGSSAYILFKIESDFGLRVLPTERGEVKPVDCPKSDGRKKQEKRGGLGTSEAAKSLV
nr:MAG TPA: hypothetical protein [Caudoviricetes sp.]